jgi:hypothetical protein
VNTDSRNQNRHIKPRKKPSINPHTISLYVPVRAGEQFPCLVHNTDTLLVVPGFFFTHFHLVKFHQCFPSIALQDFEFVQCFLKNERMNTHATGWFFVFLVSFHSFIHPILLTSIKRRPVQMMKLHSNITDIFFSEPGFS